MHLKRYFNRVRVGSEQIMICRPACPECGMAEGEMHDFGCAHEECPSCRKILIGCACSCLSPADSEKLIKALYRQFTDLTDAVKVVTALEGVSGGNVSYLTHAAMQYLYENVPSAVRADLDRGFKDCHPDLVPLLQDDAGFGYYTAEQLAEALHIPLGQVHEQIEAMVAAGQGIRFGDGIHLQKVN